MSKKLPRKNEEAERSRGQNEVESTQNNIAHVTTQLEHLSLERATASISPASSLTCHRLCNTLSQLANPEDNVNSILRSKLFSIESEEQKQIELLTRGQSSNEHWNHIRFSRLTASKAGEVVKRRKETHDTFVRNLLYPKKSVNVPHLKKGLDAEELALSSYVNQLKAKDGISVKVLRPGILLCTEEGMAFMGASLDAIVTDTATGKEWAVEVKSFFEKEPNCCATITALAACRKNNDFPCRLTTNDTLELKEKHKFFYQIQMQLAISNLECADLVLYFKEKISIIRVPRQERIWLADIRPKLYEFYHENILPELLTQKLKKNMA